MTEPQWLLLLAVACLAAAVWLAWHAGTERQRRKEAQRRLQEALAHGDLAGAAALPGPEKDRLPPLLEDWLHRSGFTPGPRLYALLLLPAPLLAALGGLAFGLKGAAALLLLAYPAGLASFLRWRIDRFHDRVVAQLPGFIDTVVRILSVGSSLELAFRNASEECEEPLRGIAGQMLLRTRAGMAIEDAMNQVAETYRIKDLSFMASVFYLGMRYGGNARAVLERIALAMRERERGQKELHAMTSETRASAWILSALPIVVAAMSLVSNPVYLLGMWADALGRQLIVAALALQLTGMWLLFRMARLRYH